MDTLIAPVPSAGLSKKKAPRNLGMEFGDGYSSVVADGLNNQLMEIEPVWNILSFEAGDALEAFFTLQNGRSFLWKLPREAGYRVWRCPEWDLVDNATTCDMKAKFREQPA